VPPEPARLMLPGLPDVSELELPPEPPLDTGGAGSMALEPPCAAACWAPPVPDVPGLSGKVVVEVSSSLPQAAAPSANASKLERRLANCHPYAPEMR
jgi:hypothetical protein